MLNVLFGDILEGTILPVDTYFNFNYDNEWFEEEDEVIKQMVRDIDGCDLQGSNVISPDLGSLSVNDLSGGVKSLIMYYKWDDFITNLIVFGNNCEEWLLRIAKEKDIYASMTGYEDFDAICLNDKEKIHGWIEWTEKLLRYGS